jgi:hypothetical protein
VLESLTCSEKQGLIVRSWKRRFFVLKKGTLYYYSKSEVNLPLNRTHNFQSEILPRGMISLVHATVVAHKEQLNPHSSAQS